MVHDQPSGVARKTIEMQRKDVQELQQMRNGGDDKASFQRGSGRPANNAT